jgi:hypothetical protein
MVAGRYYLRMSQLSPWVQEWTQSFTFCCYLEGFWRYGISSVRHQWWRCRLCGHWRFSPAQGSIQRWITVVWVSSLFGLASQIHHQAWCPFQIGLNGIPQYIQISKLMICMSTANCRFLEHTNGAMCLFVSSEPFHKYCGFLSLWRIHLQSRRKLLKRVRYENLVDWGC